MLMPLPATLRRLLAEHATLAAGDDPGPRLRDLEYTLCVSTGTRTVEEALAAARAYLAETEAATAPEAAGPAPADRGAFRRSPAPAVTAVSRAADGGRRPSAVPVPQGA